MPDPVATFVEAAGRLAAAAVMQGRRAEARRLVESALRALDAGEAAPVLKVAR